MCYNIEYYKIIISNVPACRRRLSTLRAAGTIATEVIYDD